MVEIDASTLSEPVREFLVTMAGRGDEAVITASKHPILLLYPPEEIRRKEKARQRLFETLHRMHLSAPSVAEEEVEADVEEALRQVRESG